MMLRVIFISIWLFFSSQLYVAKGSGFIERVYIYNNKVLFAGAGSVFAFVIDNTTITRTMMTSKRGLKLYVQVGGAPTREAGYCHTNGAWRLCFSNR